MRVGLLGGSFDPVHYGHLRAAQCALEAFGLEEVRLMPAHQSPFKPPCVAAREHRRSMLDLAVAGNPSLRIENCELEREAPSYTADTLRLLTRNEPGALFTLILGSDTARSLDAWREIEEIRRLARIGVLLRPLDSVADFPDAVRFEGLAISSTSVRDCVKSGRSIRYLTPPAVCHYIEEKGLYK